MKIDCHRQILLCLRQVKPNTTDKQLRLVSVRKQNMLLKVLVRFITLLWLSHYGLHQKFILKRQLRKDAMHREEKTDPEFRLILSPHLRCFCLHSLQ